MADENNTQENNQQPSLGDSNDLNSHQTETLAPNVGIGTVPSLQENNAAVKEDQDKKDESSTPLPSVVANETSIPVEINNEDTLKSTHNDSAQVSMSSHEDAMVPDSNSPGQSSPTVSSEAESISSEVRLSEQQLVEIKEKAQQLQEQAKLNVEFSYIDLVAQSTLRTHDYGDFLMRTFRTSPDSDVVLTLTVGDLASQVSPLVRIHSSCMTGDILGSLLCDCREQLEVSLDRIQTEGGLLIYLDQEARGNGFLAKAMAYQLMENGLDTVEANEHLEIPVDARSYRSALLVLRYLKISKLRLLTNNPEKVQELQKAGIQVEQMSIKIKPNKWNADYLNGKKLRLGHLLD